MGRYTYTRTVYKYNMCTRIVHTSLVRSTAESCPMIGLYGRDLSSPGVITII